MHDDRKKKPGPKDVDPKEEGGRRPEPRPPTVSIEIPIVRDFVRNRISGNLELTPIQNPYDRLIELFRSMDDLLKRKPFVRHQNDKFTAFALSEEVRGLLDEMEGVYAQIAEKCTETFRAHYLKTTRNAIDSVRTGLEKGNLTGTEFLKPKLLEAKKHFMPQEKPSLEGIEAPEILSRIDGYFAKSNRLCDEMKRVMSAKKISRDQQEEINDEILKNLDAMEQCLGKLGDEPGVSSYARSLLDEGVRTTAKLRSSVGFQPLSLSDFKLLGSKIVQIKSLFSNIRSRAVSMKKGSGHLTGKKAESSDDWQLRDEYPYKSQEEFRAIQRARRFFSEGEYYSEIRGLEELRRHRLLASERYDAIHQSRSHNFSNRRIDQPNTFALSFLERTKMDEDSCVLDSGCGMGADSVAFAQTGASVIALDSSQFALDEFARSLSADPELARLAHKIRAVRGDIRSILSEARNTMQVTHFFAHSTIHYFPPKITEKMARDIYELLRATRGYAGIAIKTSESASAQGSRHYRLTKDDGFNTSLSKEDRILRIYPDEKVITQVFTKAGFEIVDVYPGVVHGYDKNEEEEKFRFMILKVPDEG